MAKETKIKEVKKAKETKYHLKVTVNGLCFEYDTDNVFESLKEIKYPDSIKTDVVFQATKGDRKAEQVFGVFKGRRAFQNKTALELVAINLTKTLG